jgi:hypothetical protein
VSKYQGDRYRVKSSNVDRFWKYVTKKIGDECWEWHGALKNGYGSLWVRDSAYKNGGKMVATHRYSYELHFGPFDQSKIVHHKCHNKLCVNPNHLELADSCGQHTLVCHPESETAKNKAKTHCMYGHEFTPENTIIERSGKRKCKTCERLRLKKRAKLKILQGIQADKKLDT